MLAPDGGWWRDRAACGDLLDLVDAAFARPAGPAGRSLRKLCAGCPVAAQCCAEALANGEYGVWGATTPGGRTHAGGVRVHSAQALSTSRYQPVTT